MDNYFNFIQPGEIDEAGLIASAVGAESRDMADAVFDALDLAHSASAFFRGYFPIEAPHFAWGELIALPWSGDYYYEARSLGGRRFEAELILAS
ncbi:MAG: hypothetical protein ABIQ60_08265, partial [Burkholderiaceae bacterium]